MRYTVTCLLLLLMVACKGSIEIISAKKQTILPGLPTQKAYINYIFEVEVEKIPNITIDSVVVSQDEECYKVNHLLKVKNSASFTSEIKVVGTYIIEVAITEGKYSKLKLCGQTSDIVVIYYQEKGQSKKLEITSFVEETKAIR